MIEELMMLSPGELYEGVCLHAWYERGWWWWWWDPGLGAGLGQSLRVLVSMPSVLDVSVRVIPPPLWQCPFSWPVRPLEDMDMWNINPSPHHCLVCIFFFPVTKKNNDLCLQDVTVEMAWRLFVSLFNDPSTVHVMLRMYSKTGVSRIVFVTLFNDPPTSHALLKAY